MKQQKVASRQERLFFEDMIQQDKEIKTNRINSSSQRVGITPHKIIDNNMSMNKNQRNLNGNQINSNQIQNQNLNKQMIADHNMNTNLNNVTERIEVNKVTKRDRIWQEKRIKKLNSECSIRQKSNQITNNQMLNNNMNYNSNQMNNKNQISTPYSEYTSREPNKNSNYINDNNPYVNPNVQQLQIYQHHMPPHSSYNPQIINNNSVNTHRMQPTPLEVNTNYQQMNINNQNTPSSVPIMKTPYSNPNNNNQMNYNTINTNKTNNLDNINNMNNIRPSQSSYGVTPYSVQSNNMNNYNTNNLHNNRLNSNPPNSFINNNQFPISKPNNNNNYHNQNNIAATPVYQNNTYGNNRANIDLHNLNNNPQIQSQFNRTTPTQSNLNNYPVRNVITHTPMNTNHNTNGNYNYSISKPGSSQSYKPFANENISFRNLNAVTPGNNLDYSRKNSAYSGYLGRENNKFVFDKKNVIY